MTLAVAGAVRGRPATTVAGLSRSLERARDVNIGLRLELQAERTESRAFAEQVRESAGELHRAAVLERIDVVDQVASRLGYAAGRRIQQATR